MTPLGLFWYVARIGSFAVLCKGEVNLDGGKGIIRTRGYDDVSFQIGDLSETGEIGLAACRVPQAG